MNIQEMFLAALHSLLANKLRSFLTMLGILIGVAAIIAILAIGSGGKYAIVSTLESTRAQDTIQIVPTAFVEQGLPQPGQVSQFKDSDFQFVEQFAGVESVYYRMTGEDYVSSPTKSVNSSIEAGPSYLADISHFAVVSGRMYQDADVIGHRPVCLVSQTLATKLFGHASPLGRTVRLNGATLQIIGVTVPTQVNLMSIFYGQDYIYLPATTCRDLYPNWQITEMDVEVKPGVNKSALSHRLVTALNIRAKSASAYEDASGFLLGIENTISTVTSILTYVIGAIAGIALLVGGVGVMNIMLVSVTERTAEIGIRVALGATRQAILVQFLIESVLITSTGGIAGILLGSAAAILVRLVTHFPVTVSWWAVVGSFLFSSLIGVICGIYPANKAANLNPIEALRHE